MAKKELIEPSRRAQVVAIGLFLMGKGASVGFGTPKSIGAKCKEGLDELVRLGMITVEEDRGRLEYKATEKLGSPFRFKKINDKDPEEMFPIVTDDPEQQWKWNT